jgi:hypothetical protein
VGQVFYLPEIAHGSQRSSECHHSPEVECEPRDDAPVDLSVGASHPYGIRIDIQRSGDVSRPLQTTIGISAECATTTTVAA